MSKNRDEVYIENVMVDLDCLLDTRLPVLYYLAPDVAKTMLKDDSYRKRVIDRFGNIPDKLFRAYYRERSKNVLGLATPTPMVDLVIDYCQEAYYSATSASLNKIPTLYINTYPYNLNEEESMNILELIYKLLPVNVNVDMVCMSHAELTPTFVDANVATIIKYDALEWLEYQSAIGNLAKMPLLRNCVIAPLLASANTPSASITQEAFEEVRSAFGPITNLVFIQSRIFSSL